MIRKSLQILFLLATIASLAWVFSNPKSFEPWISTILSFASLLATFIPSGTKNVPEEMGTNNDPTKITIPDEIENLDAAPSLKALKIAFHSALNINKWVDRDAALTELVEKSLHIGKLKFAFKIANCGHFYEARDKMHIMIFDKCIELNRHADAKKATDKMHYYTNRDEYKKKLVKGI